MLLPRLAFVQASKGEASRDQIPEEVQGFDFKTLTERRPELKQELLGFRDHLLASSSAEETLKVCFYTS